MRRKLAPSLYNATLDLRKNLWQMFILPLYEFLLPIYSSEGSTTKKQKVERLLRNSFKSYTGLKKRVDTRLINELMGYNMETRSEQILYISEQKWTWRLQGKLYDPEEDTNRGKASLNKVPNLCKNEPKAMIKYINIQTCLCPKCKAKNLLFRCTKDHLKEVHNVEVDSVSMITNEVVKLTEAEGKKNPKKEKKLKRRELVEFAEKLIQTNLEKFKNFLNGIL